MAQPNIDKEIEIQHTDVITGDTDKNKYLYYQLKESISKANKIDIIVSFLMESGVKMILNDLKSALNRGVEIRILTGNYFSGVFSFREAGFFLKGIWGAITLGTQPSMLTENGLTPGDHSIILLIEGIIAILILMVLNFVLTLDYIIKFENKTSNTNGRWLQVEDIINGTEERVDILTKRIDELQMKVEGLETEVHEVHRGG